MFKKKVDDFVSTKDFGKLIRFNDETRQFKVNGKVYSFDDIDDVDLIIDGHSVTQGGLGRAIAGGFILGPVGALIGGVTGKKKNKDVVDSIKIIIKMNDFQNPTIELKIIEVPLKKSGSLYKIIEKLAQDITSTFEFIVRSNGGQ